MDFSNLAASNTKMNEETSAKGMSSLSSNKISRKLSKAIESDEDEDLYLQEEKDIQLSHFKIDEDKDGRSNSMNVSDNQLISSKITKVNSKLENTP